jgi:hypothetical protein
LIQSRSSDLVSGRDPPSGSGSPASSDCRTGTAVGSDPEMARGRRAGSRRRGTNALRARGRTPETDGFGSGSEPGRSRSSASAEISAASAPRTSAAAATSLACAPDDCGRAPEDSALVITRSQSLSRGRTASGTIIGPESGAAMPSQSKGGRGVRDHTKRGPLRPIA